MLTGKNSGEQKKIAFVATVSRHLEAFHIPYMKVLQKHGYEVHAYARSDRGTEGLIKNGIIYHEVPFSRKPYHLENAKALLALSKSFVREKYELVHLHTPVAGIVGRLAARWAKIPNVFYTAHGFHFYSQAPTLYWLLYYPMERLLAAWTDYLITINHEDYTRAAAFPVKKQLCLLPGIGVEVQQYSLCLDQESYVEKRKQLGLSNDDFTILSVGELNENKNHKQLIEGINVLIRKGRALRCLIVGEGELKDELHALVSFYQLEHSVSFLGFRQDIPELLACSDVVALMSAREGLPKALLEALAAGKPIVASDVRGNRDLVQVGRNGFLVPLHDAIQTAEALEKLMDSRALRLFMGQNSREAVGSYDLANVLSKMEKCYLTALRER